MLESYATRRGLGHRSAARAATSRTRAGSVGEHVRQLRRPLAALDDAVAAVAVARAERRRLVEELAPARPRVATRGAVGAPDAGPGPAALALRVDAPSKDARAACERSPSTPRTNPAARRARRARTVARRSRALEELAGASPARHVLAALVDALASMAVELAVAIRLRGCDGDECRDDAAPAADHRAAAARRSASRCCPAVRRGSRAADEGIVKRLMRRDFGQSTCGGSVEEFRPRPGSTRSRRR